MSAATFASMIDAFPMENARPTQVSILNDVEQHLFDGYNDIILAAPTGVGKTAIGAAFCYYMRGASSEYIASGGYYLVTQKLLQDQLDRDFPRYRPAFRNSAQSLKSATEYTCHAYGNCSLGSKIKSKGMCERRKIHTCPYLVTKFKFQNADLAVTNYPYFFTEATYAQKLPMRLGLVCDECHTLERQITSFVELSVTEPSMQKWAPQLGEIPDLPDAGHFCEWLSKDYLAALESRMEMLMQKLETSDDAPDSPSRRADQAEFSQLDNHVSRVRVVTQSLQEYPGDWVYWQNNDREGNPESHRACTAKPIDASAFFPELVQNRAKARLYMSAYPGSKKIFCRSLGLDPRTVAWMDVDSPFPVENRPVEVRPVGSMSRNSVDHSFPGFCRLTDILLELHAADKGIIHCHSYQLGQKIYKYLMGTQHASRVLFATTASQRPQIMQRHARAKEPTVILSPSVTEGYSFDDDLARFQIISKMPFPNLGDRQVAAHRDRDPDWYTLQAVMTVIQACGRIVRSETDHGHTYILDSDFVRIYERNEDFFPTWFTKSLILK